jgi:hypothetical protein
LPAVVERFVCAMTMRAQLKATREREYAAQLRVRLDARPLGLSGSSP